MLFTDFNLKNLPSSQTLLNYSNKFPKVDVEGVLLTLEFLSIAKEVNSAYGKHFSQKGLSEGKFTILMLLYRDVENPVSPSELAISANVTKATITGLIDGLSKDGFVRRSVHSKDRRKQTVLLTNKGIDVLEEILPDHYKKTAKLVSRLSEAERTVFVQLLRKMRDGISDFTSTEE
ncbi:MarR family winged helix-turn-helix transcriptional regulator [Rossellomorea sp. NPDC077527]|uniref:MarR family winged helix-turn-helix transcriptional regulator n=1 Tax=Rossellomorea sp. NPDC077527 TaxID=3364510 RepID=UPI0037C6F98E